ncbi:MAG: hypothetical protein ACLFO2_04595 [Candidatus Woesearchaeota archaeon]
MTKKENKKPNRQECKCEEKNPFVSIAASLGGIYLAVVAVVLIFAAESAEILESTAWAFVALGFFGMLFAYKATKK